jgi:hypothetical protein
VESYLGKPFSRGIAFITSSTMLFISTAAIIELSHVFGKLPSAGKNADCAIAFEFRT